MNVHNEPKNIKESLSRIAALIRFNDTIEKNLSINTCKKILSSINIRNMLPKIKSINSYIAVAIIKKLDDMQDILFFYKKLLQNLKNMSFASNFELRFVIDEIIEKFKEARRRITLEDTCVKQSNKFRKLIDDTPIKYKDKHFYSRYMGIIDRDSLQDMLQEAIKQNMDFSGVYLSFIHAAWKYDYSFNIINNCYELAINKKKYDENLFTTYIVAANKLKAAGQNISFELLKKAFERSQELSQINQKVYTVYMKAARLYNMPFTIIQEAFDKACEKKQDCAFIYMSYLISARKHGIALKQIEDIFRKAQGKNFDTHGVKKAYRKACLAHALQHNNDVVRAPVLNQNRTLKIRFATPKDGNCMYHAYSMALLYYIKERYKANDRNFIDYILQLMKQDLGISEEDEHGLLTILKKPSIPLDKDDIDFIQNLLSHRLRLYSGKKIIEQFINDPQSTLLYTLLVYYFESITEIGHQKDDQYERDDFFTIKDIRKNLNNIYKDILTKLKIEQVTPLNKNTVREAFIQSFRSIDNIVIKDYLKKLQENSRWENTETLNFFHACIQGEYKEVYGGSIQIRYRHVIPLSILNQDNIILGGHNNINSDGLTLVNISNAHWEYEIPHSWLNQATSDVVEPPKMQSSKENRASLKMLFDIMQTKLSFNDSNEKLQTIILMMPATGIAPNDDLNTILDRLKIANQNQYRLVVWITLNRHISQIDSLRAIFEKWNEQLRDFNKKIESEGLHINIYLDCLTWTNTLYTLDNLDKGIPYGMIRNHIMNRVLDILPKNGTALNQLIMFIMDDDLLINEKSLEILANCKEPVGSLGCLVAEEVINKNSFLKAGQVMDYHLKGLLQEITYFNEPGFFIKGDALQVLIRRLRIDNNKDQKPFDLGAGEINGLVRYFDWVKQPIVFINSNLSSNAVPITNRYPGGTLKLKSNLAEWTWKDYKYALFQQTYSNLRPWNLLLGIQRRLSLDLDQRIQFLLSIYFIYMPSLILFNITNKLEWISGVLEVLSGGKLSNSHPYGETLNNSQSLAALSNNEQVKWKDMLPIIRLWALSILQDYNHFYSQLTPSESSLYQRAVSDKQTEIATKNFPLNGMGLLNYYGTPNRSESIKTKINKSLMTYHRERPGFKNSLWDESQDKGKTAKWKKDTTLEKFNIGTEATYLNSNPKSSKRVYSIDEYSRAEHERRVSQKNSNTDKFEIYYMNTNNEIQLMGEKEFKTSYLDPFTKQIENTNVHVLLYMIDEGCCYVWKNGKLALNKKHNKLFQYHINKNPALQTILNELAEDRAVYSLKPEKIKVSLKIKNTILPLLREILNDVRFVKTLIPQMTVPVNRTLNFEEDGSNEKISKKMKTC